MDPQGKTISTVIFKHAEIQDPGAIPGIWDNSIRDDEEVATVLLSLEDMEASSSKSVDVSTTKFLNCQASGH